ncbi:MAG: major facilitator superfamily 1 [Planctomycetaceae bacterium]|nr:major facilitator superfamily 1 [Planctomycetaceae bacterium]
MSTRDAAPLPGPASHLVLTDFKTPPMRAFHMTWMAFFLCFFAWFGIAPLMPIVRKEFGLTPDQVGWSIIGSVAITIFARIGIGRLCDHYGPRLTYSWLLILGSLPVMGIAFAYDFWSFLMFRVLIGTIGASFVVTQYHTTKMFAGNVVGTANATAAGWGNLGGGVTQMVMPLLFAFLTVTCGLTSAAGWRTCMVMSGLVCAATGVLYYFCTQDTPAGNMRDLRNRGLMSADTSKQSGLGVAMRDHRVWTLFVIYACCFGLELTLDNVAVLYFTDYFHLDLHIAGMAAGAFGMMNLFARALGGMVSDRFATRWGLSGRSRWLFLTVLGEGLALLIFSQMTNVGWAIAALLLVGLFVKMSNGAVYAVVPFVNAKALGSVAGIVGAGGNLGAVAAGFLFKSGIPWNTTFWILGLVVTACATLATTLTWGVVVATEEQPATDKATIPLVMATAD